MICSGKICRVRDKGVRCRENPEKEKNEEREMGCERKIRGGVEKINLSRMKNMRTRKGRGSDFHVISYATFFFFLPERWELIFKNGLDWFLLF